MDTRQAGFYCEKPFFLARNSVSPPILLQQMIFTWIEGTFGNDNEDRRNEYLNEINEVDPDAVLPIGKELTLGTKQNEKPAVDKTDYFEDGVAKAGSLRLLVRC
ncbi:hypothetical protein BC939DRAFT_495243 [Gamsiella multidivaricata]|uniref:uncharacterized protein n=1 Tax=Gamsiella multidivaricata TaxID=101098 RepID=UPI00221E4AE2|nr:uncharacterized protein BC939DRAFT_495243 [Gamsiella multidivaricata]KAI7819396.1 hypothetical protein BC939DRAFT_495243 [Gamsiella multidivaricata]